MALILKINSKNPEKYKVKKAAEIIRNWGLVVFPTETVYGIGADALNPDAVKKIFKAKGRPYDNPLIIHIAEKKDLYKLAKSVTKKAKRVIERFWPGPLSVVLKKSVIVSDIVTAKLGSVAIRMPDNKIALSLIKESKTPIAAPSANISGRPSATLSKHAVSELSGRVDCIIDGGKSYIGLESTVLDFTSKTPTVLRPGGVTIEQLKKVLGNVDLYSSRTKSRARSPGLKYTHYSPKAKVILVYDKDRIKKIISYYKKQRKKVGFLSYSRYKKYDADFFRYIGKDYKDIAKNLFYYFRKLDSRKIDVIVLGALEEKGLGLAIMNRLRKAADKIIK